MKFKFENDVFSMEKAMCFSNAAEKDSLSNSLIEVVRTDFGANGFLHISLDSAIDFNLGLESPLGIYLNRGTEEQASSLWLGEVSFAPGGNFQLPIPLKSDEFEVSFALSAQGFVGAINVRDIDRHVITHFHFDLVPVTLQVIHSDLIITTKSYFEGASIPIWYSEEEIS